MRGNLNPITSQAKSFASAIRLRVGPRGGEDALFDDIEMFYNQRRSQSAALGPISPAEFERGR